MHIQTNTSLHLHITTFTTRGTRQRPRSSRTTQRQPQTYQRSRRLSTGSQDSITRGVQSLQISDTPAAQTPLPAPAPPLMPNSRRLEASNPSTFKAGSDHGLMLHVVQKHRGQQLLPERVGQLRHLDRAACIACDTTWSRRCRRCTFCGSDTPLRDLLVGNTFQDPIANPGTRMQHPAARPLSSNLLRARSRCNEATPSTTARFRTAPFGKSLLLAEDSRASAMALPHCIVSRFATAWAESLEKAICGHQSLGCSAATVAACSWRRSPKALTEIRN